MTTASVIKALPTTPLKKTSLGFITPTAQASSLETGSIELETILKLESADYKVTCTSTQAVKHAIVHVDNENIKTFVKSYSGNTFIVNCTNNNNYDTQLMLKFTAFF